MVAEDSKAIGSVEEARTAPHRKDKLKRQLNSKVRLSLRNFLSLLPEPELPATNMNYFARDLAQQLQRLGPLKRLAKKSGIVLSPKRLQMPNLSKLEAMERKLRDFPTRRRLLTIAQFGVYMDALRRMRRTTTGLISRVREYQQSARQLRYLVRVGRLFLDAPPDVLESFILNPATRKGSNLHAAALARIRNKDLPCQRLVEWAAKALRLDGESAEPLRLRRSPHPALPSPH